MSSFEGLTIEDSGDNNKLIIDSECKFNRSRIIIKGENNSIIIGRALAHSNLIINISGNDKIINIGESSKNINNLKIVSIRGNNQTVSIGKNFSCGGIEIQMNDGDEHFKIGDGCLFSWGIKARTSDGHSVVDIETNRAINLPKDITIGDRVWVGEDVSFLKGSSIPNDCVVGSRSVVTKSFTQGNCVIAGFPAKIVKENVKWDRRMPALFNAENTKCRS